MNHKSFQIRWELQKDEYMCKVLYHVWMEEDGGREEETVDVWNVLNFSIFNHLPLYSHLLSLFLPPSKHTLNSNPIYHGDF